MTEHRIVLIIDATYRTADLADTVRALMTQHYQITSKRAQASPARHAYALTGEAAAELITILEMSNAPE